LIPKGLRLFVDPWEDDPLLALIFAMLIGVRDLTLLIALEEQHLTNTFIGVDSRRERSRVRDLDRDMAGPFGL
jgi:hypothetical protein